MYQVQTFADEVEPRKNVNNLRQLGPRMELGLCQRHTLIVTVGSSFVATNVNQNG